MTSAPPPVEAGAAGPAGSAARGGGPGAEGAPAQAIRREAAREATAQRAHPEAGAERGPAGAGLEESDEETEEPRDARLEGRIVVDGRPAAGFHVFVRWASYQVMQAGGWYERDQTTGASGSFRFLVYEQFEPYARVRILAPSGPEDLFFGAEVPLDVGGRLELDFQFRTAEVAVRVLEPDGRPAAGLPVVLAGRTTSLGGLAGKARYHARTDRAGNADFRSVPAGRWIVRPCPSGPGATAYPGLTVRAQPGHSRRWVLRGVRACRLEARISFLPAPPEGPRSNLMFVHPEDLTVLDFIHASGLRRRVKPRGGRVVVDRLAPGAYHVIGYPDEPADDFANPLWSAGPVFVPPEGLRAAVLMLRVNRAAADVRARDILRFK